MRTPPFLHRRCHVLLGGPWPPPRGVPERRRRRRRKAAASTSGAGGCRKRVELWKVLGRLLEVLLGRLRREQGRKGRLPGVRGADRGAPGRRVRAGCVGARRDAGVGAPLGVALPILLGTAGWKKMMK